MDNQANQLNQDIANYQHSAKLCNATGDECQRWAHEYQQNADYWYAQAKHFALLIELTIIKKWRVK